MNTIKKSIHDVLSLTLPKVNKEFKIINSGGCGLFALLLSRTLREQGKRCSVVLVDRPIGFKKEDVDEFISSMKAKTISGAYKKIPEGSVDGCNNHVAVRVGNKLYDSTGDVSAKQNIISGPIEDGALSRFLDVGYWNPDFKCANGPDVFSSLERCIRKMVRV